MMRHFVFAATLVAASFPGGWLAAAVRTELIPETTAVRHGLTRPWFTQVQMDRSWARVRDIVLYEGTLYVQTDRAMVHAIDAETGATLWARQVGRPNHPSMTPGIGHDLLAILNGSRLYVCNRYNGEMLYEVQVGGAPGAGACLSKRWAYVPMIDGMVTAYRLKPLADPLAELGKIEENRTEQEIAASEEERRKDLRLSQEYVPPLSCRSPGRVLVQPLVTRETQGEEFVAWPTDRGYLNIGRMGAGRADRFAVKYRLETDAGIAARPAYLPPDPNIADDSGIIYGASRDGFVHAIRERDGQPLWRFSAGEPILQPVVVIDDRLYVATQLGGMYCLSAQTGSENWWTPQISQFVAASQQRVYAADKIGRIATLDAKTGARLDVIPAEHLPIRLLNTETDRLYLATRTGLIQCLHELEQSEPIRHGQARKKMAKEKPPTAEQEGIGEPGPPPEPDAEEGDQPGGGEDPFAPGKPPLGPPGGGNDGGADEDPFADGDSDRFD